MNGMAMWRASRLALVVFLTALLTACASFKPAPPEVSILSVRVLEMGFSEQKFGILLRLHNPNGREFVLNKLSYELELAGSPFARGQLTTAVTLPAMGETSVEVPANMRLGDFLNSAAGKLLAGGGPDGRGELDYRLFGTAQIDDMWSAPFEKKGVIDLFKAAARKTKN
jgi:LEA14-like dessication related protein